jgi:acrylyl-CoA reductase (NADPH)
MSLPDSVRALVAERRDDEVVRELRSLAVDDLGEGDVLIRVAWSSVNYKDALATIPKGQVARISPLVPGIDLAGTVVAAGGSGSLREGAEVLVHGHDLGVAHHGGYAEYARVPAAWVVPLPEGLTARQAMLIGTAGFTAALSIHALEEQGLEPGAGAVLVTGATGGVGSTAVAILAARGYEVVAASGKPAERAYLERLGAADVIGRDEVSAPAERPLEKQRWAAAVDSVGGASLSYVLRTLRYGGAVAACGNAGGMKLEATVLPFILRAVSLLGIDSVGTPMALRREIWTRLADELRPPFLEEHIAREVTLDEVEPTLDALLRGESRGRTVVRVGG